MKPVSIITRLAVWTARMAHSRGFGVQSPSAYRFIRYVINEHYPYYAYDIMLGAHPGMPWHERKLGELYLRLANFRQADRLVSFGKADTVLCEYVRHGCRATQVTEPDDGTDAGGTETWQFVRVAHMDDVGDTFSKILSHAAPDTLLIIEDIKRDPAARRLWRSCTGSKAVSVTCDLYYCGIAFFDTARYKQNYTVNF